MNKLFSCFRKVRFLFRSKQNNKKWLNYLQNYCSNNSKYQWCELIVQNFEEIRNYTNASEETLRQLKSTNISSEIIKVIRKDYERKQVPFCTLVDIFLSYIINKYSLANSNQLVLSKIQGDTENFIDFMRSLIVIYYQLQQRELIGDDQFFRVTLSNFITECLFSKEEFYNCIIQITKLISKETQQRISFNMQKFLPLTIDEYGINSKYTLNAETITALNGRHKNQQIQKPYIGPIKMVKEIVRARTPMEKTKCLQNLLSQVEFSINKFYEDFEIQEGISLDADNAISILLYILVQSQQSQLITHLNIIYSFLNKEALQGKLRFCLDTIKACLQFLQKGSIRKQKGLSVDEAHFSLWINARSYFQHVQK